MSLADLNPVSMRRQKRVAMVVANPAQSTTTGWPVGFWWSELTHPYLLMSEVGYAVEIFSPYGGACVGDAMSDPQDPSGYSRHDIVSRGFIATPELVTKLERTRPVSELMLDGYDALVVAGGQSPMFSFEAATEMQRQFVRFFEAGKVVAALCHGTALLAFTNLSNGEPLVRGRTVTGFSNAEEDAVDETVWGAGLLPRGKSLMPWRIEDRLRGLGANFVHGGLWRNFAVRDGNLITGQQNYSGQETARLVIEALGR